MRVLSQIVTGFLWCVLALGCDIFLPAQGSAGQPCTDGGLCLDGLACIDDQCVNPDAVDGDEETDTDTDAVCVCTSGPCCDGCHYRTSSYVCNDNLAVDYQCVGSACGDDAQKKTQVMTCSGASADCNGATVWGYWTTHENCGPDKKCESDNQTYASCSSNDACTLSCSSGVCTDPETGFEWQETPTGGTMNWESAKTHCTELTLDSGGWRLPNISELRSLIRNCSYIETGGVCGVQDECSPCGVSSGDVCLDTSCYESSVCNPSSCSNDGGPTSCYWPLELNGMCGYYWSSSRVGNVFSAWYVSFSHGNVYFDDVVYDYNVQCVRDAP